MKKKNKRCKEVVEKVVVKIPKRNLTIIRKNLHGNCKYVGQFVAREDTIILDARLKNTQFDRGAAHEGLHCCICFYVQALGCGIGKDHGKNILCQFSKRMDDDPLLILLLPEYEVGQPPFTPTGMRERFWSYIWLKLIRLTRWISYMRLRKHFPAHHFTFVQYGGNTLTV